jgi:hypothetical protein
MDAFGGNDEESAELKKLNAEMVSGMTAIMRSSQCFADMLSSLKTQIISRSGRNLSGQLNRSRGA